MKASSINELLDNPKFIKLISTLKSSFPAYLCRIDGLNIKLSNKEVCFDEDTLQFNVEGGYALLRFTGTYKDRDKVIERISEKIIKAGCLKGNFEVYVEDSGLLGFYLKVN